MWLISSARVGLLLPLPVRMFPGTLTSRILRFSCHIVHCLGDIRHPVQECLTSDIIVCAFPLKCRRNGRYLSGVRKWGLGNSPQVARGRRRRKRRRSPEVGEDGQDSAIVLWLREADRRGKNVSGPLTPGCLANCKISCVVKHFALSRTTGWHNIVW